MQRNTLQRCTLPFFFAGRPLTTADFVQGLDLAGGHDRGGPMEYDSLPSVEGLLLDLGGARELQRNGRRRRGDQDAITASRSDGSISEEQGEKDGPLSTPPASVEGSETGYELAKPLLFDDCHTDRLRRCRYSIRDEQKADFTSDIAPPHLNALYSSTTDGRTCESSDGARRA